MNAFHPSGAGWILAWVLTVGVASLATAFFVGYGLRVLWMLKRSRKGDIL